VKQVVFIESSLAGAGEMAIRASIAEGFKPILLTNSKSRYPFLCGLNCDVYVTATDNYENLLQVCTELTTRGDSLAVATTADPHVVTAARIAHHFDLPGPNVEAVARCKSKVAMRDALSATSQLNPWYDSIDNVCEPGFRELIDRYPIVVKPDNLAGGTFIKYCETALEVDSHIFAIREALKHNNYPQHRAHGKLNGKVLCEEFLPGTEYAVTTFNGVSKVLVRHCGAAPESFQPPGRDLIVDWTTPEAQNVVSAAERAVEILGIDWGPAHVQIRFNATGQPKIIEVNPRLPGGMISEIGRLGTGFDLVRNYVRCCAGLGLSNEVSSGSRDVVLRYLYINRSGVICALEGVNEARCVENIHEVVCRLEIGKHYSVNSDRLDRHGHVIAVAPDPGRAARQAGLALSRIYPIWR
jgi:biotin carboxylase